MYIEHVNQRALEGLFSFIWTEPSYTFPYAPSA